MGEHVVEFVAIERADHGIGVRRAGLAHGGQPLRVAE